MAAVIAASSAADQVERAGTVDDLARAYTHLVNSDPDQDMLMVEVGSGQWLVGRGRSRRQRSEVRGYNRGWCPKTCQV